MLTAACKLLSGTHRHPSRTRTLASSLQIRTIRLYDIFDKKKIKERREKLKEEASKGYWDDFKELKDSKGKVFQATQKLLAASAAPLLPDVQVLDPSGSLVDLRAAVSRHQSTLICVAFRSGAEEMLSSWSYPFAEQSTKGRQHIELSLVESVVMSWWPFKGLILRGGSAEADAALLKPKYLFHFGNATPFIQSLQLSNRLTGYAFLVDSKAKIRWRGSGTAAAEESASLLRAAAQLSEEQ